MDNNFPLYTYMVSHVTVHCGKWVIKKVGILVLIDSPCQRDSRFLATGKIDALKIEKMLKKYKKNHKPFRQFLSYHRLKESQSQELERNHGRRYRRNVDQNFGQK